MHPKVLIVGTVPYDIKESSRAFDAYFHYWEKENLAQIFSNSKEPSKGHCGTLFQITDKMILKRWIRKNDNVGRIFYYEKLKQQNQENHVDQSKTIEKAYMIGRKHTPLTHLLRGILWKKKYWCTPELNCWLDSFKPECVFLAFSDDYFISQIALYVANRYQIPIVSCIGDDYYFNKHISINPLYQIYKESYKYLIRKVFKNPGSAIYISDKIRDKYNTEFGLNGETVYLTSTIERKDFSSINKETPLITYFGNIRMGRNDSLCDIANVLGEINPNYKIEIYSNEKDNEYYEQLKNNPNVIYGGSIPYEYVKEKMKKSDITLIVEGFKKNDIELSRYSLSTKAADALASGAAILTYGSSECGIIEYMKSTEASVVCTKKDDLKNSIELLIKDIDLQKKNYEQQIEMTKKHHNIKQSCAISEKIIANAIQENKEVLR